MLYKILTACSIMLLSCLYGRAQDPYEFYYNNLTVNDNAREIEPDMSLFLRPLTGAGDVFTGLSDFNFSAVRYSRRGYPSWMGREYVANLDLSDVADPTPDYAVMSVLRRAGADRLRFPGAMPGLMNLGSAATTGEYSGLFREIVASGGRASLSHFNRRGQFGARASLAGGEKVYGGAWVSRRWGRDMTIDGVFADEISAAGGLDVRLGRGNLSVFGIFSSEDNGLRGYATGEAFRLTGDNYYNQSWGYYRGAQKSARTATRLRPNIVINYEGPLARKTSLCVSLMWRGGEEKRGSMAWYDAETPYPDYYRYMPSYSDTNDAALWLSGDTRVTQLDWERMIGQNLAQPGSAAYVLEQRVRSRNDMQFAVSARTVFDNDFTIVYGIRLRRDNSRYFKEMASLLGAGPVEDVDRFLIDDEIFGDRYLNDTRNPGRRVGEGDRFGYNYRMMVRRAEAWAMAEYRKGGFRIGGGIEAGHSDLQRDGLYEKELFPGNGSYGRSAKLTFNPYTVKLTAGYAFSPRHFLDFSGSASAMAPYAGSIFMNPEYSNMTAANPSMTRVMAADLNYTAVLRRATLKLSLFATRSADENALYRYWDDISSAFADMSLSGICKLFYGAEVAGEIDLSPRLTFSFAGSWGSYTYDSNPSVTIIGDATHDVIAGNSTSYLAGYRLGSSPELALTGELGYSSWGWLASLTGSYTGGRYVDVSPLRRMERAYGLAASPEMRDRFTEQEKLGDAFTLDIFLLRSFRLGDTTLSLLLSVSNLLGDTDIVYNGYEQMRVLKKGAAPNVNWQPFDSRYLYSYGRTYYVSLSYRF